MTKTKRLRTDESGSVAVIFVMLMLVLLAVSALALDLLILSKTKSKLQSALDFATLSSLEIGTGRTFRTELFEATFDGQVKDLAFVKGVVNRSIAVSGRNGSISAVTNASAVVDLPFTSILGQDLEINLASGGELIMPLIELSLVLDISSSMAGTKIIELQDAAEGVVDLVLDGTNDSVISIVPFGGSVRVDPSFITNLNNTPARSEYWLNGTWNQCFTYDENDLQNGFGPSDSHDFIADFTAFGSRNSWCPEAGNEAVFATRDSTAAKNLITNFSLTDGTSTDVGVAWGINALSSDWRGHLPGAENGFPANRGTTKVLVVMSDGAIVNHYEPDTGEITARVGHPDLNDIRSDIYRADSQIIGYQANRNMQAACARARAEGITVYAIAFDVDSPNAEASLQDCAGDINNYFEADPGELLDIFERILDDVAERRLTL